MIARKQSDIKKITAIFHTTSNQIIYEISCFSVLVVMFCFIGIHRNHLQCILFLAFNNQRTALSAPIVLMQCTFCVYFFDFPFSGVIDFLRKFPSRTSLPCLSRGRRTNRNLKRVLRFCPMDHTVGSLRPSVMNCWKRSVFGIMCNSRPNYAFVFYLTKIYALQIKMTVCFKICMKVEKL